MVTKLVHVAVGVIVNADGKILIAKRPLSAHQGGLWEFPGGKVDADETVAQALMRELHEELAIEVCSSQPLIQIRHSYPDKSVLLDVHKITRFNGNPIGNEGQPIQWAEADALANFNFPAANLPIISAITLPDRFAITGDFADNKDFDARLTQLLAKNIRLLQLRLANFCMDRHQSVLEKTLSAVNSAGARLVINCSFREYQRAISLKPDINLGLHLNRHHVVAINQRPVPRSVLFGVSCHGAEEIIHAQHVEADYLFLSPVLPTGSHPGAKPLGWDTFAQLVEQANIPVFALGGVGDRDIKIAQQHGAQGVAGITAWW